MYNFKTEIRTEEEAEALYKMYLSLFVHSTDLESEAEYCNKVLETEKILRAIRKEKEA